MNIDQYKDRILELGSKYTSLDFGQNELLNRTYCFTSANIGNFMPKIPYEQHQNFLRSILMNREKSIIDGKYEGVLNEVVYENLNEQIWAILNNTPSVICTFHFGSMQIINHFFAFHKIDYAFIASKKMLDDHLGDFLEMAEVQSKVYGNIEIDFIEADEYNTVFKMLKALKQGKHLLIYIDGNTGTGYNTGNLNLSEIQFLSKTLYVRSGAATIAFLAKVPLLAVIGYRNYKGENTLRFFNPIFPAGNEDKAQFIADTMQRLYDNLSSLLQLFPDQWECWIYLHSFIKSDNFSYINMDVQNHVGQCYQFNKIDFGLWKINDEGYLFCKRDYTTYLVQNNYYEYLKGTYNRKVVREEIDEELITFGVFVLA